MNTRILAAAAAALWLAIAAAPARAEAPPPAPAAAARDSAKLTDIKRLMALTGMAKLGQQVFDQLMPTFKAAMPNVPAKFWADFAGEAHPEELIDLVALIYDKHLSHDDVKAIIAFYETPAGKNLIAVQPAVTQEAMVLGQEWGRKLGERIARKLEAQETAKPKK